jgi:hypothetical protein
VISAFASTFGIRASFAPVEAALPAADELAATLAAVLAAADELAATLAAVLAAVDELAATLATGAVVSGVVAAPQAANTSMTSMSKLINGDIRFVLTIFSLRNKSVRRRTTDLNW